MISCSESVLVHSNPSEIPSELRPCLLVAMLVIFMLVIPRLAKPMLVILMLAIPRLFVFRLAILMLVVPLLEKSNKLEVLLFTSALNR
jgi:hypothetical protein